MNELTVVTTQLILEIKDYLEIIDFNFVNCKIQFDIYKEIIEIHIPSI